MSQISSELRFKVISFCIARIQNSLQEWVLEKTKIQDAANNETKSSMGDKYETGRAMAQNEIEKLESTIFLAKKQLDLLAQIKNDTTQISESNVRIGSLIELDNDLYMLAVPIGKITIEQINVICISALSPIGKQLISKKSGEEFLFLNQKKKIGFILNA